VPPPRRRARLWIVAAVGVFVFAAVCVLLAIALNGAGTERGTVLEVLQAQARGDVRGVLAELPQCRSEPGCAAAVRARAPRLKAPGKVEILLYEPSVHLALTRRIGTGRVAWRVGTRLPVVQCVRVQREGPLSGGGAELLSISDPIGRQAPCPA
jgi:hypothetical protein